MLAFDQWTNSFSQPPRSAVKIRSPATTGDSHFRACGNHDRHRIHSATVGCGSRASSLVRTTTVTSPTRAAVAVAVAMLRLPGLREITLTPNFNNESAKIVTWEPDAVILAIPPAGV